MIFVLSIYALLACVTISNWGKGPTWQRIGAYAVFLLQTATVLYLFGVFGPEPIASDATNYSPAGVLLTGLVATAYFAALVYAQRLVAATSHARTGAAVFGAVIGVYFMFVAADHWWFFRGDNKNTGWAHPAALGVKDMDCDLALVRAEGDVHAFRCAHLLVFNQLHREPFVPWPSYTSGISLEFRAKSDALLPDAKALQKGID